MFSKKSTDLFKVMMLTIFASSSQIVIASEAPSASRGTKSADSAPGKDESWERIQKRAKEARIKREAAELAKGASSEASTEVKKDRQWITQQSPSAEREANLRVARQAELGATFGGKASAAGKSPVAHQPEAVVVKPVSAPEKDMSQVGFASNSTDFKGTPAQCRTHEAKARKDEESLFHNMCQVRSSFVAQMRNKTDKYEEISKEHDEAGRKYGEATKITDAWQEKCDSFDKAEGKEVIQHIRPTC